MRPIGALVHPVGGEESTIAAAHDAAAIPIFLSLEYHSIETDWIGAYARREGAPQFENGFVPLVDAPGPGYELNREAYERHLADSDALHTL